MRHVKNTGRPLTRDSIIFIKKKERSTRRILFFYPQPTTLRVLSLHSNPRFTCREKSSSTVNEAKLGMANWLVADDITSREEEMSRERERSFWNESKIESVTMKEIESASSSPRNLGNGNVRSCLNKYTGSVKDRSWKRVGGKIFQRRNQRRVIVPEEKNRLAKKFESWRPILSLEREWRSKNGKTVKEIRGSPAWKRTRKRVVGGNRAEYLLINTRIISTREKYSFSHSNILPSPVYNRKIKKHLIDYIQNNFEKMFQYSSNPLGSSNQFDPIAILKRVSLNATK